MRTINYIAVHCTATPQTTSIDSIRNYWKTNLKWKMPGYHFIVKPDGEIVQLLDISEVSNGVFGHNHEIINISYIGGIDKNKKAIDNRTEAQKKALQEKLKELKKQFPNAIIQGHRDFKGVKKDCPSFNAKKEYENI